MGLGSLFFALMTHRLTLLFVIVFAFEQLAAQPQLENASFEAWDNSGQATQEPQQWSSLKTSDGGALLNGLVPQLCWRSTDAHTGQFSVNLRTVSSVIGAANGLLTNGRVHAELAVENSYMYTVHDNEQWRTAISGRPDSIVGWFKATPQTGDRANLGALLHVDEGRLPAFGTEANYVAGASWKAPFGPVDEWTRFSASFQYLNDWAPEWILLILTAGDSAGSQVGTQAWFDDLALIYNVHCEPSVATTSVSATQDGLIDVGYSTGGVPMGPVAFTVELSDANGDFSTPLAIGSVVSTAAAGVIPCTVPAGTAAGSGYSIRVVTDSPFYAAVGCAVEVEFTTGLTELTAAVTTVCAVGDGLLIDATRTGSFVCYSSEGRLVASGLLRQGLNAIALNGVKGLLTVRVEDGDGSRTTRSFVP